MGLKQNEIISGIKRMTERASEKYEEEKGDRAGYPQ